MFRAEACDVPRNAAGRHDVRMRALARGGYPGRRLPAHMLPELRTVGYWDATEPQSWGLDWHRDEGIELSYVARGKTGFGLEERTYLLTRGDLAVTRPWQDHRVGDPNVGACRLHWVTLDVGVRVPGQAWRWPSWLLMGRSARSRLSDLLLRDHQPVWSASEAVGRAFERLGRLVTEPFDSTTDARLKLLINEVLVELLHMLEERDGGLERSPSSSRRKVEAFLSHLTRRLDEPWTLESMSGACGLARSQFATYCRELTNASPHAFLKMSRLAMARRLLRDRPELSVTEVANACGFSSSQYFATAFKHDAGIAPSAYRASRAVTHP